MPHTTPLFASALYDRLAAAPAGSIVHDDGDVAWVVGEGRGRRCGVLRSGRYFSLCLDCRVARERPGPPFRGEWIRTTPLVSNRFRAIALFEGAVSGAPPGLCARPAVGIVGKLALAAAAVGLVAPWLVGFI